jgi:hypothetical protein
VAKRTRAQVCGIDNLASVQVCGVVNLASVQVCDLVNLAKSTDVWSI